VAEFMARVLSAEKTLSNLLQSRDIVLVEREFCALCEHSMRGVKMFH
jgi:hypothetical protein